MTDVISTTSSDTVGDVASSLDDPGLCFWPLAQARPLTLPSRFYFMNIRYYRALFLSLSVRSPVVRGLRVLFMWSYINSLGMELSPFSLNCVMPLFRDTCVIT